MEKEDPRGVSLSTLLRGEGKDAMSSKVTYRQQYTRCGKQRCRKCREGAGHGPYWYAYWSENGRTISKYIGMQRPTDAEVAGPPEAQPQASHQHSMADQAVLPGTPQPVLRIYLLGQFRVERRTGSEWQPVTNRTWQRRRARALLGCLLSSPGRRMGREQTMEALWPELDIETAANRLNGAVHELRQILEPEISRPAASSMLRLQREVLELADRTRIWVDADDFESLLNQANTTSDLQQVEQILEEAGALYGGDYLLEELYSEWATPRREALRRRWMGLLLNLAELRAARGALASAIEPLDRLLVSDPIHETAVRQLMLLLTQLDRRGEALQAYHRLNTMLQRDYGNEPLPETRELYEDLRQGHFQAPRPKLLARSADEPDYLSPSLIQPPPISEIIDTNTLLAPEPQETQESFPRPVFQPGRYNQSPLIGRDRELADMRHVMSAVSGGSLKERVAGLNGTQNGTHTNWPAHFLLLMGEAGIGKTRLAEELSHEANTQGWSVVWSRSYEQEGTIPYRPWTELLRILLQDVPPDLLTASLKAHMPNFVATSGNRSASLVAQDTTSTDITSARLERLSALLPELRAMLPQLNTLPPLPPEQERLHLWEATLGLFSALSHTSPVLLVLDDLHWADESSLELLAYLARHLRDQRVLLVGTCRDVELLLTTSLRTLINDLRREQAIVTLPLQPLTQAQIAELVAYLPENVVESIQTQAGGNPFFAEELARYTSGPASASVSSPPELSATPLPETIAAVLDRRLSRLSQECQALLGRAAVFGGPFEFNQLLFMDCGQLQGNNEDTVLDMLEEALRAGILTEEGIGPHVTYHFWHPLIISHLYERLSAARRAQLHRRAASALLQLHPQRERETAAAVTHHLIKGGGDLPQIARYAEMAGHQAYSLSAYGEAEHYYRQAILAHAGLLPSWLISHQDLSSLGGSPQMIDEQGKTALHLLAIPSETLAPLHLARLLERVGECSMKRGDYVETRHLYERVLELRIQQQVHTLENESAEELRQHQQRETQIQALIWREIGYAWANNGEYANAYECYERGMQVMRNAGVTSGVALACLMRQKASICYLEGEYEEARGWVHEALEMLEQAIQSQQATGGQRYIADGELQTRTEQAITGHTDEFGQLHELLGVIVASTGQFSEALEHMHTAMAMYEKHDLVTAMTKVCGNLGAVYIMKSDYSEAQSYLRRSLELAERMSDLPNMGFIMGNLGDMTARMGNLPAAEEWFKRSLTLLERVNDRAGMAWCFVVLAETLLNQAKLQEALEYIQRALLLGRAMHSSRNIAPALIALGNVRILQAILACQLPALNDAVPMPGGQVEASGLQSPPCKRLLLRARNTLQRALSLEGLEVEFALEGKLMQAAAHFLLDDLQTARETALTVVVEAKQHELHLTRGRAQRLLGQIFAAQGQLEQADEYFEQSLQVCREYEFRLDYARTLYNYVVSLLQRAPLDDETYRRALAYLQEVREAFIQSHAAIDLERVERLLVTLENQPIAHGKN